MFAICRFRSLLSYGWLVLALACLAGCGGTTPSTSAPGTQPAAGNASATFTLTSPSFAEGAAIPAERTCDGTDLSPALRWEGAPAAQSFALIADDPDAPGGTFTHWVLFDIPGTQRELPAGTAASTLGIAGRNDFGKAGYGGPCPPPGAPHRYIFTLFALDVATLGLPASAPRRDIEAAMRGHTVGQARLVGNYGRK
jgi:Raf kinase inhibitor-like YbhB/YbcL family protein